MKSEDGVAVFWGSVVVFFLAGLTIQTCRPTTARAQTATPAATRTPTPIPTGKIVIYKYDLRTEEGLMFWHYLNSKGKRVHEGMTVRPRLSGESDVDLRTRLEVIAREFVRVHKDEWNLVKPVPTKIIPE